MLANLVVGVAVTVGIEVKVSQNANAELFDVAVVLASVISLALDKVFWECLCW